MTPNRSLPSAKRGRANPGQATEFYRQLVHELIEIGRSRLQEIRARIDSLPKNAGPAALVQIAEDFERVSRAVRRGIMLDLRLAASARSKPRPPTPAQIDFLRQIRQYRARLRVIRQLEDMIRPRKP